MSKDDDVKAVVLDWIEKTLTGVRDQGDQTKIVFPLVDPDEADKILWEARSRQVIMETLADLLDNPVFRDEPRIRKLIDEVGESTQSFQGRLNTERSK